MFQPSRSSTYEHMAFMQKHCLDCFDSVHLPGYKHDYTSGSTKQLQFLDGLTVTNVEQHSAEQSSSLRSARPAKVALMVHVAVPGLLHHTLRQSFARGNCA